VVSLGWVPGVAFNFKLNVALSLKELLIKSKKLPLPQGVYGLNQNFLK
jgi:hypothetical protein